MWRRPHVRRRRGGGGRAWVMNAAARSGQLCRDMRSVGRFHRYSSILRGEVRTKLTRTRRTAARAAQPRRRAPRKRRGEGEGRVELPRRAWPPSLVRRPARARLAEHRAYKAHCRRSVSNTLIECRLRNEPLGRMTIVLSLRTIGGAAAISASGTAGMHMYQNKCVQHTHRVCPTH